jgi:preprotein translocase subunit SecF
MMQTEIVGIIINAMAIAALLIILAYSVYGEEQEE